MTYYLRYTGTVPGIRFHVPVLSTSDAENAADLILTGNWVFITRAEWGHVEYRAHFAVLRTLNADAKAWPYYRHDRVKQRDHIRQSLNTLRDILSTKDAYQSLGFGSNAVYYESEDNHGSGHASSLSGYDDNFAALLVLLGVPTINLRATTIEAVTPVVWHGPLVAVGGKAIDPEPRPIAYYRPLGEVAEKFRDVGAVILNADRIGMVPRYAR